MPRSNEPALETERLAVDERVVWLVKMPAAVADGPSSAITDTVDPNTNHGTSSTDVTRFSGHGAVASAFTISTE